MLQGQIAFGKAELVGAFVQPAGMVVASALGVEAGKNPRGTFFGVAKIFAQNARGVGVMRDVIVEKQVVIHDVSDQAAQEGDVAPGPDGRPYVCQRTGAGKSWINMDDGRAAFL